MRSILFIVFFVLSSSFAVTAQEKKDDIDYARTGDYFPYVLLTEDDSL